MGTNKRLLLLFGILLIVRQSIAADDISCIHPECDSEEGRATLWPFYDPNFYLRCEERTWELVRRPCIDKRLFKFVRQECVDPYEWVETCPDPHLPQCPRVVCKTKYDQRKLWPYEDPSYFLQCVPGPMGGMEAVRRDCDPETLFSWTLQQCVEIEQWERDCTFEEVSTPGTTEGGETETTAETDSTTIDNETTDTEPDTTDSTDETTTTETTEEITTTESETDTTETTEEITDSTPSVTTPSSSTTEPTRGICPVPVCRVQDPHLYPHTDWTLYYQCVPDPNGFWVPAERPCGAGTYFHAGRQMCLFQSDWEDFCL
ncbi:uncharacterized protein LOC131683396 [Topomyia yanbarensis]|uniref:uncharacterized protein LOC131683396 n=1 Tax=Topomyia yanbarensis TaxID=2498891 RepID=UPI00273B5DDF|nr:uncharacterized protein LOC131683396 [Topomyia yanbarensis]